MAKLIATIIYAIGIWLLFRLNREKEIQTSTALWIPTFWLFICASRSVTQWLGQGGGGLNASGDGSPLDRAVLSVALALGLVVLVSRGQKVVKLLKSNIPILLYFLYCGLSVFWSDFPDVAFKRWFRGLGDLVMVLIILSEADWLAAFRRVLTRLSFVLVPISILFIRYYPQLGRFYSRGGQANWTGVCTDKNQLGMICMIFGLAAVYRFIEVYRGEESAHRRRLLIAQGSLLTMIVYLLITANSATAFACFFLAGGVMVLTCLFKWARIPVMVNVMVALVIGIAFSALFINVGSGMVQELGRDSTLTGRTKIWRVALGLVQNPLFGTGYESFWLGQRVRDFAAQVGYGLNQAHNGYIETYLNLGWVGVALLALLLVTGYPRIVTAVRYQTQAGSLRLAYLIVAIAYNFTEAGFVMMHPMWIILLLTLAIVPEPLVLKPPNIGPELDNGQSGVDYGMKREYRGQLTVNTLKRHAITSKAFRLKPT